MHYPLCKTAASIPADAGKGALVGLLLGQVSRSLPQMQEAKLKYPAVYDAAFGAALATLLDVINRQDGRSLTLPGQTPGAVIPSPGWTLM